MIEWCPVEEDGWVLTNGDDVDTSLSRSPDSADSRRENNSMKFSVDIKDLRSFQCVEPKRGAL